MENTKLINLTDHVINLHANLGKPGRYDVIKIPPSGILAKSKSQTRMLDQIEVKGCRVNITFNTYDIPEIPEPVPNTLYIVSSIVAQKYGDTRNDLVIPNGLVRDGQGTVIACRSLARV